MHNKIYIQTENEEYGFFNELKDGLVSWSTNKLSENDIEFYNKDFVLEILYTAKRVYNQSNKLAFSREHICEIFNIMEHYLEEREGYYNKELKKFIIDETPAGKNIS